MSALACLIATAGPGLEGRANQKCCLIPVQWFGYRIRVSLSYCSQEVGVPSFLQLPCRVSADRSYHRLTRLLLSRPTCRRRAVILSPGPAGSRSPQAAGRRLECAGAVCCSCRVCSRSAEPESVAMQLALASRWALAATCLLAVLAVLYLLTRLLAAVSSVRRMQVGLVAKCKYTCQKFQKVTYIPV